MGHSLNLLFGLLLALIRANVLKTMWSWFVVSAGMYEALSFNTSLGIVLILSIFKGATWEDAKEHDLGETFTVLFISLIKIFVILAFGWLIKTGMLIK